MTRFSFSVLLCVMAGDSSVPNLSNLNMFAFIWFSCFTCFVAKMTLRLSKTLPFVYMPTLRILNYGDIKYLNH